MRGRAQQRIAMAYRQYDMKVPSYLEDFMDEICTLPTVLKGKFNEMREMDDRATSFMADADKAVAETLRKASTKGPSTEALKKAYQDVISLQGKATDNAMQKVEIAERSFEVVDEVIRNLDDKLREFETQLRKDGRWPVSNAEKPPRQSVPGSSAVASGTQNSAPASRASGGSGIVDKSGNVGSAGTLTGVVGNTTSSLPKTRRGASGRSTGNGVNGSNGRVAVKTEKGEEEPPMIIDEKASDPNEPKYCYCKQVSYGDMVACDNEDCPIQWFHFKCVSITEAPPDGVQWLCRDCKKNK